MNRMSPSAKMLGMRVALQDGDGSAGVVIMFDPDAGKPWWLSATPRIGVRWDDGEEDVYRGEEIGELVFR